MEWLNNPWFVGIGGGVLSGFIVTWLSRFVLRKRDSREYRQKVSSANRDVVYAIRPGISEGQMPTQEVLAALVNATARRAEVESKDLFSPAQIAEELIKEVMDSSFISSATKAEYCNKLAQLKGNIDTPSLELMKHQLRESTSLNASKYRERYITMTSAMAGLLTAMTGALSFVVQKNFSSEQLHVDRAFVSFLLPASVVMVGITVPTMLLMLRRLKDDKREEPRDKKIVPSRSPDKQE